MTTRFDATFFACSSKIDVPESFILFIFFFQKNSLQGLFYFRGWGGGGGIKPSPDRKMMKTTNVS